MFKRRWVECVWVFGGGARYLWTTGHQFGYTQIYTKTADFSPQDPHPQGAEDNRIHPQNILFSYKVIFWYLIRKGLTYQRARVEGRTGFWGNANVSTRTRAPAAQNHKSSIFQCKYMDHSKAL